MAKKICLISGHTMLGRLRGIDTRVLNETDNRRVLVLNMISDDSERVQTKGNFFSGYFREIGASDVQIATTEMQIKDIESKSEKAGLLYLPGGDTNVLVRNLRERGLDKMIQDFNGVIAGNSAGAYAIGQVYPQIRDGKLEVFPMMGLVDFSVKLHYKPEFESLLRELSYKRLIFALEDESAILCNSRHIEGSEFIGTVWKFAKGDKERVH